jgi:hypothetical protein
VIAERVQGEEHEVAELSYDLAKDPNPPDTEYVARWLQEPDNTHPPDAPPRSEQHPIAAELERMHQRLGEIYGLAGGWPNPGEHNLDPHVHDYWLGALATIRANLDRMAQWSSTWTEAWPPMPTEPVGAAPTSGVRFALVYERDDLPPWLPDAEREELEEVLERDSSYGDGRGVLVLLHADGRIEWHFDGGEPEDQTFARDWSWVIDLLAEVATR